MFRVRHASLFLFAALLAIAAASSPPNLVTNGGFEEGIEGPKGWRFNTAKMEIFEVGRTRDAAEGKLAARIVCHNHSMSGYWSQSLKVAPHTRYRLTAKVKLESGKILIYAHGKETNARLYLESTENNPLVPVFVPFRWSSGGVIEPNRWTPVSLEFDSGNDTAISINLGAFFRAGSMNFDEVELRPIP